jgi:integrase
VSRARANARYHRGASHRVLLASGSHRGARGAPADVATSSTYTLNDALADYWRYRVAKSPAFSVEIDKSKARAHLDETMRVRPVAEFKTADLERWYHGLAPATEDREAQRRAKATAERVRRLFFAAHNHAYRSRREDVPSADAWRAVRSFRNVDRPRRRFLSVREAKRLLNSAPPDFRRLARGALYTGLRLGELLALRAADCSDEQVHMRHSKAGPPRNRAALRRGRRVFEQAAARQGKRCTRVRVTALRDRRGCRASAGKDSRPGAQ